MCIRDSRLFAGTWRPLVSVITTLYYTVPHVCILFHWIAQRIFNRHHHHPLGYLCAKFCFCSGLCCWASPWRKITYSITHSLTQLIWCSGNRSLRLRTDKFCGNLTEYADYAQHTRSCVSVQILWELAFSNSPWFPEIYPGTTKLSSEKPWNCPAEAQVRATLKRRWE